MAASASPPGSVATPLRVLVALLGLLVPLHLPFTVPELGTEKTLGWWSTPWGGGNGPGLQVTQTTWYARTSGLAPGDRVLRVEGRPATEEVVSEVLDRTSVGERVEMEVSRGGRAMTVHVSVVRSSVSYVGYWWYRLALVLGAWVVGMALVVWHGRSPPAFVLGTAFLLVAPVIVTVAVPLHSAAMRFVNSVWQHQATSYRFLFPALLGHFVVLQRPLRAPEALRKRGLWLGVYGIALVALALSTDFFRDPLAWTRPGTARLLRTTAGLAFEVAAVAAALLLLRYHRLGASTLRWLTHSLVLYLLVGVLISMLILTPGSSPVFIDSVRQLKTLALLLLVVTAALYCLSLRDGEPSDWALRGRLSTTASMALTALFGFAVAAAAAVVHSKEPALGEMEVLLFFTIFVAAIGFSPVLRWAREMVDRQILARWIDLEARVGEFTDRLGTELEPVRIAERVSREVPGLLGVEEAELVLSRELADGWRLADAEPGLRLEPEAALRAGLDAAPDPRRVAAPLRRPDGEPIGVLRLRHRPDATALDPPERRALSTLVRGVESSLRSAEAYLRLRDAQGELADAERVASLGALAGGLAHEIKNPLMGLKLGLHLLAKDGGDTERLRRISSDVRRIDDLVTGLLRFTHDDFRDEAGPVDLPELVRACLADVRPLAEDRGTTLVESYPEEPAVVHASRTQLRLVVGNLVKNALDAVNDGGMVEVGVRRGPGAVELRVADDGPGIPRALRDRIFELAFSTKPGGSGLGLALAKREAERLGGSIEVDSGPDGGTTLRVRLPAAASPPCTARPHRATPPAAPLPQNPRPPSEA